MKTLAFHAEEVKARENASKASRVMKRILAPTDFSPLSRVGVEAAMALAQGNDQASLALVHVIEAATCEEDADCGMQELSDLGLRMKQAKKEMDQLKSPLGSSVNLTTHVIIGPPASALCEMVRDEHVDLVVLSSHGRAGLERMLIGSVAEKIVQDASCPVLVVKPARSRDGKFVVEKPKTAWKHILVGYDHRPGADLALAMGAQMAQRGQSRLTLLHALPPPDGRVALNLLGDAQSEEDIIHDGIKELGKVCHAHQPVSANWDLHVAIGHPWDVITDHARETGCDLIIVGPHEHTRWGHEFMGSTAQRVVRLSPCAVLAVK